MSKRTSQPSQSSPQPASGVDFLVRTMIERESTGKRPIRPKNVEDLLHSSIPDESDDPDFDCGDEDSDSMGTLESDEGSNESGKSGDEDNQNSDESDDEDYKEKGENEAASSSSGQDSDTDSDSSNDQSQGSDSDEQDTTKKSALRETLEKLNESNNFMAKRPAKKKRKVAKNRESSKSKKVSKKSVTKKPTTTDSTKGKTSIAHKSKSATKKSKSSKKLKKVISAKKIKTGSKKTLGEKRKKKRKPEEKKHRSIRTLIDDAIATQKENRKEIEVKKPICSACLGDKSDDANEIVECDSCGISVHEICYGLSADNVSVSSGSGSSSQTEPWFCDVCKSGSENIFCELCPVEGGLFKESTAGRWVHLVCALYTQNVVVHNDSIINLYEIHYARWGSHNCAACDNERLAQTGIVISCDAGMCKTYFHATCAQKLGLLSDPAQVDFAEADPYYVSCKLHTNRETMKRRIRLFNSLQEQLRIKKEQKEFEELPSGVNADHARILRKLDKVRCKTALKRAHYLNSLEIVPSHSTATTDQIGSSPSFKLPNSWTNGNKKQRLMHTSAKLGIDFFRKTDRLGEDIAAHELEVKHEKIVANVKRKWNVLPAMGVEFAAYYTDREHRITGLMEQYEKSVKENQEMMDKEIGLKDVWETQIVNQMAMAEETDLVGKQLNSLVNILSFCCPNDKKLSTKLQSVVGSNELPGVRRKSPSMSRGDRKSPTPKRSAAARKAAKNKNRVLSPSPSRAGKIAVAVCDTCSKSDSQHLITRCDKCGKHYHLGCLDPPLTRMPKRTRLCGWMCSDCCEAPSETEGQVDTEAPRTLRGRTKIHKPRKYRGSDESEDEKPEKKIEEVDVSKTGSKKSPKSNTSSLTSPEMKSPGDPSPSFRVHSSTPMERRRRSGSANNTSTISAIAICSPIAPLIVNGPNVVTELCSTKASGKGTLVSEVVPNVETKFSPSVAETKSKKARVIKVPKIKEPKLSKSKQKKVKGQDLTASSSISTNNYDGVGVVTPSNRKSLDGTIVTVKVNGVNDAPLRKPEDNKLVIPKAKPRIKKKKAEAVVVEVKSEQESVTSSQSEKVIKPKKPRKKKEGISNSNVKFAESFTTDSIADVKQEVVGSSEKVKKPKKKKEKKTKSDIEAMTVNPEAISTGKKTSVKSKPKVSMPLGGPCVNASREETNGVNLVMGKVTSKFIVDKLKSIQNGAMKISKKRKSSSGAAAAALITASHSTTGTPNEKEKSVPPKKRKRVSSSAQQQQGQPNNVDSVIEAVSSGNFSNNALLNGVCNANSAEMSTIMQGVSPISRQHAPEQNLMQGKQMVSGVNTGEMVTVDTSFLIDGAHSSQYDGDNNVAKFYSSSNHQNSPGGHQDESGVLKLTSAGSSSNSENVIRLQYIDASSADSSMSPPLRVVTTANVFASDVCATCTKATGSCPLVKCDKCQLEFHFTCLNPPMKHSPRRKGHPWFCNNCDDGDGQLQENGMLPPSVS